MYRIIELTEREEQITALVMRAMSNLQIAATLGIRPATVSTLMKRIFDKSGMSTRLELALWANRRRVTTGKQWG